MNSAKGKTRTVTVTFLEMLSPPERDSGLLPAGLEMLELSQPSLPFYRALYKQVGQPWGWVERLRQTDEELRETITPPAGRVFVPYWHGMPAGLVELNLRECPDVQLNYFGLTPEMIGSGLGHHVLAWIVHTVWQWSPPPRRLWLHTCSTDSPRAMPCYTRAGFVPYHSKTFEEEG